MAIPPGTEVVDVNFDAGKGIVLPGVYDVSPTPMARVIGQEDPVAYAKALKRYEANYTAVYDSNEAYPGNVVEFVRTAGYRKHNLVDVRVTPLVYRPLAKQLVYYPEITLHVNYRLTQRSGDAIVDNLERTERVARNLIVNYAQAEQWYPRGATTSRGLHDFVIITLDSLTSSVTPLVNWETAKGRTVQVVTTTWINTNYSGGYDLAENMRNFLRDKYPSGEWGIEDVLLVGHYDDVPMRRTSQDLGCGAPETDYYYAELSLPDSESWDADGDHQWGENEDPIDFYTEVNVGRIPWSSESTVQHICEKSVAYEQNNDPAFKKNILLLGAFFWDTPDPRTDNAVLMEAKVDQPWMSDWTMTRMYEQGYSTYTMDYNLTWNNVRDVWSTGTYAFVNWAGHGTPTSSKIGHGTGDAFVSNDTCPHLNDNYPAIIFADACSNCDTDFFNIGQAMLQQGGVGFVGSNKGAFGCGSWNDPYDGSSQSLDYFFTTYVTSGDYTQGQAHQRALREMYINGLWYFNKFEMFEWGSLWGNPNLGMSAASALNISFPGGLPEYLDPGVPTIFTVQIEDRSESYVDGSGTLHYRYDGGTYLTSILVHDTGDLYDATLPATTCDDTPEFYISAQGDLGTTVVSPADAPASTYTATVGQLVTIFEDDFETDQGWTTGDDGDATSGFWQRGVPVNDPNWYFAAAADSDGSGQCWLTENDNNLSYPDPYNTDVDDGAVYLYSPILDLSGGDIIISYDYYLCLTDSDGADRLLVEISSNGIAGPWSEIARHDTNSGASWRSHTITQGDLDAAGVTLTATMKLRFDTNDADPQSINESGLDAFLVTGLTCESGPTCDDGILNQGEDLIDCGGPCPACDCLGDGDCLFCNGETCDAYGECQDSSYPCTGSQWCDETTDGCVAHGNGNCDGDSDVDLADFAEFQVCFDQEIVAGSGCAPANMIGTDGWIDLADFAEFAAAMIGP
ncbi:MAG: hypothetical protein KAV82_03415 [Phycisphaerae bacterium]|nr:hypothetical protein [Phycisphaerae bacterium]